MQTLNTSSIAATVGTDTASIAASTVPPVATDATDATVTTDAAAEPAKPAKRDRKRPNGKPAAAKPAKPEAAPEPSTSGDDSAAERKAARDAVCGYYPGASLPFKAASDTFAPFRTDKAPKRATERQAALLAAMLVSGDNIGRNGRFTRGGFVHDGKRVQPETGCLSDMHGRVIQHVSGALAGKQARDAVFAVNLKLARSEISALLGDKLGKLAIARIDTLLAPKPKQAA
jgi:hypothetical protein